MRTVSGAPPCQWVFLFTLEKQVDLLLSGMGPLTITLSLLSPLQEGVSPAQEEIVPMHRDHFLSFCS